MESSRGGPRDYPSLFRRLLQQLERRCQMFDAGHTDEAVQIAVLLRVLLHNTRSQTSLLRRLGAEKICLLSTCELLDRKAVIFDHGLAVVAMRGLGSAYEPALGRSRVRLLLPVPFWWWQIVSIPELGLIVRRKDLILGAADKEGAHIDESLSQEYGALAEDGAVGTLTMSIGDLHGSAPVREAHWIYLRQIGYEVLQSTQLRDLVHAPAPQNLSCAPPRVRWKGGRPFAPQVPRLAPSQPGD